MGSPGLWIAVDARNALMKDYLDDQRIMLHDAELETAFWKCRQQTEFRRYVSKG